MSNRVFRTNNQPTILTKSDRKITWLSLPQLMPISKYYTRSNFIQTVNPNSNSNNNTNSLMIIDKNTISLLTVTLPPLNLNIFKQDILDWQPMGGVCLTNIIILYNKHTINFYERANMNQNIKKTWTIQVMQQITQIKSSYLQRTLGMTVNQKKNTIFLWNLHEISNKPYQQIAISEEIVKWQFKQKDMLAILTEKQFQIYYPQQNQYNLYYFIQFAHVVIDFCFLDRPRTNQHSGRRTVYPIAILGNNGKIFIYQLYDIDKRIKYSIANIIATIQVENDINSIICGYERDNLQVVICCESKANKPFCITLNQHFTPKNMYEYLQQLDTADSKFIQYCKDIICTEDIIQQQHIQKYKQKQKYIGKLQQQQQQQYKYQSNIMKQNKQGQLQTQTQNNNIQQIKNRKLYKLYKLINKQQFKHIQNYQCNNGFAILGSNYFYIFSQNNLQIYQKTTNFTQQTKIIINQLKAPSNICLLQQKQHIVYFISGIKIYRLDIINKTLKVLCFTIKNQKFKLLQIRSQTRSLLYTSNNQYILMQYALPQKPQIQTQKLIIKIIKSSQSPLISLRNNRWLQQKIDKLIIGQNNKILVQFDLAKFFKLLTQQSILLQYNIFWTTHDGIFLMIKNYIFVLQLIESTDGYSLMPIKRSNNYLHIRLNPDIQDLDILDARNIVIKEGKRIMKLGNKFGNFICQDPYDLPDTLLRRQLLMRKMYPPHHPKIIQYLIQQGYFGLLQKLFQKLWEWAQNNGTMKQLYQKIGIQFYKQFKKTLIESQTQQQNHTNTKTKSINILTQQSQNKLKKLCQFILQNPHILNLQQKGSLILQSQIQAIIYKEQNQRSLDIYSSVILTQYKTHEGKNQQFSTMQIAYMLHSMNKQQAIRILKEDRKQKQLEWDWIKKYSIILWYENKNQLKNWAEEIGTNLFKINKQPMQCLFWYTVAGKKNVLIQLFKKYTFNSSQHQAIYKFLQRDFSQQKNKVAAAKNAYVLIDKKRYLHALAFFIYGQKIDQAISLCLNKLKDINLAYFICYLNDDMINKNKIVQLMVNEGDVWLRHIGYYYKNMHIDSFNCLFEEQNVEITNKWAYQIKLTNFHPCLYQFAEFIEKSIPVKRQLQQQQMNNNSNNSMNMSMNMGNSDPNDIFAAFYEQPKQTIISQVQKIQKVLLPNYQYIVKQSIAYYIRNGCSILALMLDQNNYKAKRSYDLCQFMLTKQVNNTVIQLIYQMEDYQAILHAMQIEGKSIKNSLQEFYEKFKKILISINFSMIYNIGKNKIGELLHYSYLANKIINKINSKQLTMEDSNSSKQLIKNIISLIQISKIYIVLQLQIYQKIQQTTLQYINYIASSNLQSSSISQSICVQQNEWRKQCWNIFKSQYDKIPQIKKNKKQNLYDSFQQILYKYTYKKNQLISQTTNYKLNMQQCLPIYIKKLYTQHFYALMSEKNNIFMQVSVIFEHFIKNANYMLNKWGQENTYDDLYKQFNIMMNQGVSAKLKLHILPQLLGNNFQNICRALIQIKNKVRKPTQQKQREINQSNKNNIKNDKINKNQVIQIFRNKTDSPKYFSINKNQGLGIQLALLTKRGVKKLQVCESLVNRNRSQDGVTLIHEDSYFNMENQINFNYTLQANSTHPPIIQKFYSNIIQNRKQYDGLGIIKGSSKRTTPQYLKSLDNPPYFESSQINCIQCHHFLPIYMLGGKSNIQLCTFSNNRNYNRIKCPTLNDITKIRSYEQRVTVLDNSGTLNSYSFDSKISSNCVFSIKKNNIIDFCPITPTTYGFCTGSGNIQVIDSLLHPKRQAVFKIQTNQQPIAVQYYNSNNTKLAICRKSDILFYDIRMDILQESRDIGGRAKCMVSNYKNKILIGKYDNKVRVLDMAMNGNQQDYDIKCISSNISINKGMNIGGMNQSYTDKAQIEDIQIMGKLAVALNSQGSISLFSIQ